MSLSLATEIFKGDSHSSIYVREEGILRKKQAGCQSKYIKTKAAIFNQFSAILIVKQDTMLGSICAEDGRNMTSL